MLINPCEDENIHTKYNEKYLCVYCKDTRANKKYDNHCMRCFIHLFPDKPVSRNYKTKEKEVTDYVKNQFIDFQRIEDKNIM